MTAGAISLTDRVRKPAPRGSSWTTPASDLRVMLNGLEQLGYDADALVGSAGLREVDLENPDARVSCEAYGAILSRAQQERFTPNLALELARRTPLGAYPLLDYLVATSESVGAGVRQLAQYLLLTGNPAVVDLHEGEDGARIELTGAPPPFTVEYFVALMILHLRNETDGRFAASNVSFRHQPDDAGAFERILGCPVRCAAPWAGVSVPVEAWRLPLRRRDPILRKVLESHANEILARLPKRTGVVLEVQRAITQCVTGGDARFETIARQLAMSRRTLQRRLAAEGASYQQLLDEARKGAAAGYLSDSILAIGEVAYLVGYSEPAPFHRAFKRWYGMTPEAYRQARREGRRP
jgi:AraC-like DNA-binding protein